LCFGLVAKRFFKGLKERFSNQPVQQLYCSEEQKEAPLPPVVL
jgi:hypothetical protein